MKLEFIGDWNIDEATRIARQLKKSIVPETPIVELLSDRSRELVELLQSAGGTIADHDPCENPEDWSAYGLEKSASDEDGVSDTEIELIKFKEELRSRIDRAVEYGAMLPEIAEAVLEVNDRLTVERWIVVSNLGKEGYRLVQERIDLDRPETYAQYLKLLAGRGLKFWADDRSTLRECMAEDYRYAHDPYGLPNLVTLEWDLAVPSIARMSQQVLLSLLNAKS